MMITATIICLIIFTISTCLVVFGAFKKDWLIISFFILAFITCISAVVLACMIAERRAKQTPIEYPASKYSIEIKVTEFQGNKDTTYVLIPKEL